MRWLVFSAFVALAGLSALIGCTQIQTHDSLADLLKGRHGPNVTPHITPSQEPNAVPRDISHVSFTPYVIEASDVLTIEAVVRDPKAEAATPLPGEPISGTFVVRADGSVGLGVWGSVSVKGLNLNEASVAIRKHLANHPPLPLREDELVVVVDILTTSKHYYVIIQVPNKAEQVHTFPCTGAETVLDVIAKVDGLAEVAGKRNISLKRRKDSLGQPWESLPVDWKAITQNGVTTTNYQLQSGDRIYVTHKFPN